VTERDAALDRYLRRLDRRPSKPVGIPRRPHPERPAPLSFSQQHVWLHSQLASDVPLYNEPLTIHRRGPLDVGALERALSEIVRRHEVWRTTYRVEDGRAVQVVGPPPAIRLSVDDLRAHPEPEREALRLAREDAVRPFDLARGPLVRTRLVRVADDDHRLFLTLHHILFDGVSIYGVLLPELIALYEADVAGVSPSLPELSIQHADFSAWQHAWKASPAAAAQLEYWRGRLAGSPPMLELPADHPRPATRSFRGTTRPLALDAALTASLRARSRDLGATLFSTMLAAFVGLLHRYTGEEDAIVGTMTAGRKHPEVERLLGCFLNPLALRIDLRGEPTFRTLVGRVKDTVLDALAHDDVPFEQVVTAAQPARDPGRHPLFSAVFSMEPPIPGPIRGWHVTHLEVDPGVAKFDLQLELHERADGIVGRFVYCTDLFEPATIARLEAHYRNLLAAVIADPDRPLWALPLLGDDERHQVLAGWNQTARPYPSGATVHALFEQQVARAPHSIALEAGDTRLTYAELNQRADALARHLRTLGVGGHGPASTPPLEPDAPGVGRALVGVAMERSPELIIAYLAALKAGAAYLPLSPGDPPDRLAFMLADSGAAVVLTRRGDDVPLDAAHTRVVDVADGIAAGLDAPALDGVDRATPDDLVYVMYTSGSTGRPKGVAVPHRGIVRLVFGQDYVHLGPDEVVLQVTALSFDVSAFEIWGALLHGARLVLHPSRVPLARELRDVIRRHGVTMTWLTGSLFNGVVDEDPEGLAPLRQLVIGGEALSVPHVARAAHVLPATQLINGYGPTECSVFACGYPIPRPVDTHAASIPIGPPIANTEAYVLDAHMNPTPIGVPGELYLGGPGVARGYLNRPELTAERFVPDPFRAEPAARLYRTGDLARWRSDGTIEFLGRRDSQVKIRGLRIELGEIESALALHPAVREAAVVVRDDGPGGRRLVAYVVPRGGEDARPDALREFLKRTLPAPMVPATFVALDAVPLTPSGKLDRRALPAPPDPSAHGTPGAHPPRDPLEAQLVELWQDLLGVQAIGVTDDFFELGGDSLLAARMVQQIGELTGRPIPLAVLYAGPTVERLARLVDAGAEEKPEFMGPTVTLNRTGARPPLFLFHGVLNGGAFYALRLARRFGADQPIHVVHPFADPAGPIPATIEAMADEQLPLVQALQPHGPYRLSGYCNGGLVAYEVARRLQAQGEEVEMLALIASAPVRRFAAPGRLLRRLAMALGLSPEATAEPLARLRSFAHGISHLSPREWAAFVGDKLRHVAPGHHASDEGGLPTLMEQYYRIVMRYFSAPYRGPVLLLWPEEEPWGPAHDAVEAWRPLVPAVRLHTVPGDHHAIVRHHADLIADHLGALLTRDRAEPREPSAAAA